MIICIKNTGYYTLIENTAQNFWECANNAVSLHKILKIVQWSKYPVSTHILKRV